MVPNCLSAPNCPSVPKYPRCPIVLQLPNCPCPIVQCPIVREPFKLMNKSCRKMSTRCNVLKFVLCLQNKIDMRVQRPNKPVESRGQKLPNNWPARLDYNIKLLIHPRKIIAKITYYPLLYDFLQFKILFLYITLFRNSDAPSYSSEKISY